MLTASPVAARLRLALDMYEFGEQLQRARLRRLNPEASETQIDAAIGSWLADRPDAPLGDMAVMVDDDLAAEIWSGR